MRKTRNLIVLAMVLLAAAALPNTAQAADWSVFLSWYDTTDLEDALGFGIRGSFPFNENWEADVTASYYEDFEDAIAGPYKVEVGFIPVDFGVNWNQNGEEGGFNAGAGLTYAFMDIGGLEIANVDIPDFGEADDEFGAYAKLGWRHENGFLFEVLYRFLDVSIESIQLPPGVIVLDPIDRIDLDMDGFAINVGWRF
ncbi:MAG: outer membrane beta-barrel protein [Planctomycetota bacterium]|jgi:hypothetical protein